MIFKKRQEVEVLKKDILGFASMTDERVETPIKKATVRFELKHSKDMYNEPMYWCHVETVEERRNKKGTKTVKDAMAFFESELKLK